MEIDVFRELKAVAEDRKSGASQIFEKTCRILEEWSSQVLNTKLYSEKILIDVVKEVSKIHPTMAPLRTLSLLLNNMLRLSYNVEYKYKHLNLLVKTLRNYRLQCLKDIVEKFQSIIKSRVKIFTLSYSSLVFKTLTHCKELVSEVLIVESKPGSEGLDLAKALAMEGFNVKLAYDTHMPVLIREADITLLGVDTLLPSGDFINKVGSLEAAILSKEYDVDLIVLLEPYKIAFWAKNLEDIKIEKWNSNELKIHKNIKVIQELFENVPSKYVTRYIIGKHVIGSNETSRIMNVHREFLNHIETIVNKQLSIGDK